MLNEKDNVKREKRIETDPFGMWTGVPIDENDEPMQDVDDL